MFERYRNEKEKLQLLSVHGAETANGANGSFQQKMKTVEKLQQFKLNFPAAEGL